MSEPPKRRPRDVFDEQDAIRAQTELADAQSQFERFAGVLFAAKRAPGPPLFVSKAGAASRVVIKQYDAGRDATYLTVSRQPERAGRLENVELADAFPPRETIGFLRQVAGTDIIYDLTDETLQGKCRPFVCDLTTVRCRVYALLPVQIEAIALTAAATPAGRTARVEFHDARGQRLQALLPFHFRIEADGKEINTGYYVTESDGRFDFPPKLLTDLPPGSKLIVRSQLTGREQECTIR